jgi:valyl-tRNA synthetase
LTRAPGKEGSGGEFESEFAQWKPYASTLAKLESFDLLGAKAKTPTGVVTQVLGWCEVSVKAPEGFDFAKTRAMIEKKLYEVSRHHEQHLKRLASQDFLTKAASETQEQTRERAEELSSQRKLLEAQLDLLTSAG